MTTFPAPICLYCLNYRGQQKGGFFCTAYPTGSGIPQKIINSQADHRKPYGGEETGSGGRPILFLPEDQGAADYAAFLFEEDT